MPKSKAHKVLKQDKRTVLEWHSRGRRFDPDWLHKDKRRFSFRKPAFFLGTVYWVLAPFTGF